MSTTQTQPNCSHPSTRYIDNTIPCDRVLFQYRATTLNLDVINLTLQQGLTLHFNNSYNYYRHHIAHCQSSPRWYFLQQIPFKRMSNCQSFRISYFCPLFDSMSLKTDAEYKKEYTTFIQNLSSEFVKIYPSDSAGKDLLYIFIQSLNI